MGVLRYDFTCNNNKRETMSFPECRIRKCGLDATVMIDVTRRTNGYSMSVTDCVVSINIELYKAGYISKVIFL